MIFTIVIMTFLAAAASTSQPMYTMTPALKYFFSSEECSKGVVANSGWSNQTLPLHVSGTTQCLPSLGIQLTSANSSLSTSAAENVFTRNQQENAGVAFEFWLKPTEPNGKFQQLMAIGKGSTVNENSLSDCERYGIDFSLALNDDWFQVSFRAKHTIFESCRQMNVQVDGLYPNKMAHVVVSLQDGQQLLFVNGKEFDLGSEPFNNDLSHWSDLYQLWLLSYMDLPAFKGSLYQFGIYATSLEATAVEKLLSWGLSPTDPWAVNYLVTINEDAEVLAGSHDASWYTHPTSMADASHIKLRTESVDQLVQELLNNINRTSLRPPQATFFYITRLPTLGHLYTSNGFELNNSNAFDTFSPSTPDVVYIPPINANSNNSQPFACFEYCVSSTPILNEQDCSKGTVKIVVDPVNDPPVANDISPIAITEGIKPGPKILLSGSDVDANDFVSRVEITQPPQYGHLILSVGTFRSDGLRHGTPLSDLGYVVSTLDDVYVQYVWDPDRYQEILREGKDVFTFRVSDKSGTWSVPKSVSISVLPAVQAFSSPAILVPEDSRTQDAIVLRGIDLSGYERKIGFFIESIPRTEEGVLIDSISGAVLNHGAILTRRVSYPYIEGAALTFLPAPDFCNSYLTSDTQLGYRVIAFNDDGRVVSTSPAKIQHIKVECRADGIDIEIPNNFIETQALNLRESATGPCRAAFGSATTPDSIDCRTSTEIKNISIIHSHEPPLNVTLAVSMDSGYISFDKAHWNETQLIEGRLRFAPETVIFSALLADLNGILTNLRISSNVPGIHILSFILQYGDCKVSASENENCQILRRNINVSVREAPKDNLKGESPLVSGFPWQILICLIGYPAVYFFIVQLESLCTSDDETIDDQHEDEEDVRWVEHMDDLGNYYYEDRISNSVSYLAPVGERIIPWKGEEEKEEV